VLGVWPALEDPGADQGYAAFGAFVLNSVEFLTGVWHYSAVRAGLAIGPGPLMVLPFARVAAPRLAAWIGGPGRVAVIGCVVNAGSQLLWYSQIQVHPAYLTHLLPAQLLGGAGVGLAIPSLLGAGSASLRRTGSAPAAESSTWPARSGPSSAWPVWSPSSPTWCRATR
jgi:hypothetical protein